MRIWTSFSFLRDQFTSHEIRSVHLNMLCLAFSSPLPLSWWFGATVRAALGDELTSMKQGSPYLKIIRSLLCYNSGLLQLSDLASRDFMSLFRCLSYRSLSLLGTLWNDRLIIPAWRADCQCEQGNAYSEWNTSPWHCQWTLFVGFRLERVNKFANQISKMQSQHKNYTFCECFIALNPS